MTESPSPSAKSISVPDGRNEQIRMMSFQYAAKELTVRFRVARLTRVYFTTVTVAISPETKLINSEQNSCKKKCTGEGISVERNCCDIALNQSLPSGRIGAPSEPHTKVADQVESSWTRRAGD